LLQKTNQKPRKEESERDPRITQKAVKRDASSVPYSGHLSEAAVAAIAIFGR